jgi:hypothetical protein
MPLEGLQDNVAIINAGYPGTLVPFAYSEVDDLVRDGSNGRVAPPRGEPLRERWCLRDRRRRDRKRRRVRAPA